MTERSADDERSPAASVERATRCHPSPVMELAAPTTRSQSVFGALVTAFVIVMVVRLHEVVPLVGNLRLGKILVLPLAVMTVVALPRWQVIYALRTAVAKWVGVIIGLALLSVPLSIWPTNSARYFLSVLMPALFLFIIVSAGFSDRVAARRCILALVLTVGIDALFILVGPAPRAAGRPYIGAYLDPNESAALFVFTVPFALGLGSPRERRGWLGIAITMLLVAGVVETGSRGGVVGLLIVAVMLILRAAPSARRAYVLAIACCAAVFVSAADDAQLARFGTIFAPKTDYNLTDREGRLQVWRRGVGYMLDRPLFGTGINNFETAEGVLGGKLSMGHGIRYTAAHNSYVQIGAELGVFGLVAFLAVIWSAARGCQRIRQRAVRDRAARGAFADDEAQLASSAFCALVGFAATGFFLSMAYHPVTFFAFAVCAGVQAGSPYRWFDPPRPTRAALSHAEWRRTVELARGAASAHPA